jgi:4-hydroxybenzoate polyprenyltransferase
MALRCDDSVFRWTDAVGILLCMVFARSAAMAFNRWADRRIDAENPRTAERHLPGGRLSARSVVLFTIACSIGFIGSTLIFLPNVIPTAAAVPVLMFLFVYSYAKRFTSFAHIWLGAALMLAPLAAWVVIRPEIVLPPILLGLAVLFWTAGFDLIYACQDAEFDAAADLHSVPGRYGIKAAFRLSAASHAATVLLLAAIPLVYAPFGPIFFVGIGIVALILLTEHFLARPGKDTPLDLVKVNVAFFQMNVIVSVGLLVVGIIDLVL